MTVANPGVMLTLGRSDALRENWFVPDDLPAIEHMGPFSYVELTYSMLRVCLDEDAPTIGHFDKGVWWLTGNPFPFSNLDIYTQKEGDEG